MVRVVVVEYDEQEEIQLEKVRKVANCKDIDALLVEALKAIPRIKDKDILA